VAKGVIVLVRRYPWRRCVIWSWTNTLPGESMATPLRETEAARELLTPTPGSPLLTVLRTRLDDETGCRSRRGRKKGR